uniref:Glycerol-3-phosphate dehydrogenase [NAD(+)] n=1 Tax=Wuchereria bancrofti TaxID=6293 RepID=A0A1I8E9Q5_WUCBA
LRVGESLENCFIRILWLADSERSLNTSLFSKLAGAIFLFVFCHTCSMGPKTPIKVTLVGSGNWGSAISLIIGKNVQKYKDMFDHQIRMWVYEEIINGMKLTEVINTQHENIKYLPGKKLPPNVVAIPDLLTACKDSDILIFVIPHQFVENVCIQLKGHLKEGVLVVSLIKGFMIQKKKGGIRLVTEEIRDLLDVDTAVLMGANLAPEVANEDFCEATIGCKDQKDRWSILQKLFDSDNFKIALTEDANTVELCGGLKVSNSCFSAYKMYSSMNLELYCSILFGLLQNIVACAAGFADGLGYGSNTKSAIIRLGLMEITIFVELFYHGSSIRTFFESCGVADLIATCSAGRNRKICEAFVKTGKSIKELEQEMLNGQSAQGPLTAEEVYLMLKKHNMISIVLSCAPDMPRTYFSRSSSSSPSLFSFFEIKADCKKVDTKGSGEWKVLNVGKVVCTCNCNLREQDWMVIC